MLLEHLEIEVDAYVGGVEGHLARLFGQVDIRYFLVDGLDATIEAVHSSHNDRVLAKVLLLLLLL